MKHVSPKVAPNRETRAPLWKLFAQLPAWLFMVVVVAMSWEVVARYFFHSPTIWANELSLFVCAIAYVYAGVYIMAYDGHLRVTVLYDLAPPGVRRVFDVVQCVVIVGFCLVIAVFGSHEAWLALATGERFGTAWNAPIPMVVKPLVVVCALVMALLALNNLRTKWSAVTDSCLERAESTGVDEPGNASDRSAEERTA